MKRYPKYKDSGIDWLGEIPQHWEVKRLKFIVSNIIQQRNFKTDSETYVALEHIESWTGKLKQSDEEVTFESTVKCFRPNDVLFGKLRPYLAKAIICEKYGVCVGELLVIRVKENTLIPKFILFNFLSKPFINIVNSSTYGAKMPRASWEFIGNLGFHIPPLEEQNAIACFIDRKLVQIDQFISNKQRFIELLKEQKRAIVNRAVTKGLNPDAPMKPSGIEWLGDIPQGWEVTNVRSIVHSHKQGFYTNEGYVDEGTPLLRITDINDNSEIDFSECPHLKISQKEKEQFSLSIGDFVFVRSGATIGKFGLIRHYNNAIFGSYLIRFTFKKSINQDYLKYFFISPFFRNGLFSSIHGGANVNINAEDIKTQKIIVPPLKEQEAIGKVLNRDSEKINQAIAKAEKEIELIQEYRTTLISDAVTGKIDVREITTTV